MRAVAGADGQPAAYLALAPLLSSPLGRLSPPTPASKREVHLLPLCRHEEEPASIGLMALNWPADHERLWPV